MLNWIAIWLGVYCFQQGGPLQAAHGARHPSRTRSSPSAQLPVFWGSSTLQGLDVGIFISLALAVVFWPADQPLTLGYEVRAVGFNPDAAAYAGINVGRT